MPHQKDLHPSLNHYKSNLLCDDHRHRMFHGMHLLHYLLEYEPHALYRKFERKHILPHILAMLRRDI